MPARLVSLDGRPHMTLTSTLAVVGRHRDCDLHLDSTRVSRRHCCLALDGDRVIVRDLGSTNGTWLNGQRVGEGLLRPGDELSVAHLRFRLEANDPDPDPRRTRRAAIQENGPGFPTDL
jgi:pSer/pThr/pTyr-binding forkhead associated (FHA) protein